MLTQVRRGDDEGSILLLVIGYTTIAAVLLIVGVDLSSVFLARRALGAAADSAALQAAQGINRQQIYAGSGLRCGQSLPLSRARAVDAADAAVREAKPGLDHQFRSLGSPAVSIAGGTATVQLTGAVKVPFNRVVSWLDPSSDHGSIEVSETSHAHSPVVGPAGC